jgi:hypothetical protein
MGVVPKADTKGYIEAWMKDYLGTQSTFKKEDKTGATAKSQTYINFHS